MRQHFENITESLKLPQESRERIRTQLVSYQAQMEVISMKKANRKIRASLVAAVVVMSMLAITAAAAVTYLFRNDIIVSDVNDIPISNDNNSPEQTILEANGLVFEPCTEDDIKVIKRALGAFADKFKNAWKVTNLKTQKRYDEFIKENKIKKTKLLFHGSRNENWWSIINTGLCLRPTNAIITGKLYGIGIYLAPKAQKSIGYTSVQGSYWARGSATSGFMALMDVAYGTPYDVYDFNSKYHSLTYDSLQEFKKGANCLHAHAGASMGYSALRNDEIVIYKEEQCTIKYLVEIKN